jgi:hypothetical protein
MAAEFVSHLIKDFDLPGLPAIALTYRLTIQTVFAHG